MRSFSVLTLVVVFASASKPALAARRVVRVQPQASDAVAIRHFHPSGSRGSLSGLRLQKAFTSPYSTSLVRRIDDGVKQSSSFLSRGPSRSSVSSEVMDVKAFNAPKQIFTGLGNTAAVKAKTKTSDLLLAGFLAGAYISFGSALQMTVASNLVGLKAMGMAGLATLISASIFPVCFIIHVLAGSELWTGNCAVMTSGALQKKCKWSEVFRHWSLAFLGNLAGAMAFSYFLIFKSGLANEAFSAFIANVAAAKTSLTFSEAFLRGIGANWLVCLAVVLVQSASSVPGKILGAWFPVMTFVATGFEHSVANMFTIPLSYMTQAGSLIEFKDLFMGFLTKNLIPVTLGNIVGGAVFVGMFYDRLLMRAGRQQEVKMPQEAEDAKTPQKNEDVKAPQSGEGSPKVLPKEESPAEA
mmetsp:Transcript_25312/g.47239  ORF Transcript_25312/g.47239 Transcript_25312/m.47239 type:complete len:412 (-) Transcript_25312:319-1554(-)